MQFSLTTKNPEISSLVLPASSDGTDLPGLSLATNASRSQPFADVLAGQTQTAASPPSLGSGNPIFTSTAAQSTTATFAVPTPSLPESGSLSAALPTSLDVNASGAIGSAVTPSFPGRAVNPLVTPVTNALMTPSTEAVALTGTADQYPSGDDASPASAPTERQAARLIRTPTRAEQEQAAAQLLVQSSSLAPVMDFKVSVSGEIAPATLAAESSPTDEMSNTSAEPKIMSGQSAMDFGANLVAKYSSRSPMSLALARPTPVLTALSDADASSLTTSVPTRTLNMAQTPVAVSAVAPITLVATSSQTVEPSNASLESEVATGQPVMNLGANIAAKYSSLSPTSPTLGRAASAGTAPADADASSLTTLLPTRTLVMAQTPVAFAAVAEPAMAGKQIPVDFVAALLPSEPTPSTAVAVEVPALQVEAATVVVASVPASGVEGQRPALRASREIFSDPSPDSLVGVTVLNRSIGLKKILNADKQIDKECETSIGIGVAELGGKMRQESQLPFASALYVGEIAVAPSAVNGLREAIASLAPEAAPVAAPRVQSVITYVVDAATKLDAGAVKGMDLRFDFGANERLFVHVELRDGAVHTTFRTDSQLLRDSIGTAWREVAPAHTVSEGRSVRLADPVIARDSSADLSAQADGGHARQHSPQQSAEFTESTFILAAGRTRAARRLAALVEPIRAPQALRPDTALHLHAVA